MSSTYPLGSYASPEALKAYYVSPCEAAREEFLAKAAVIRADIEGLASELKSIDQQLFDDVWHGPDGRSVFIVPTVDERRSSPGAKSLSVHTLPVAVPEEARLPTNKQVI